MSDVAIRNASPPINGFLTPYLETDMPGAEEAVVFVHGNPGSGHDRTDLMRAASDLNARSQQLLQALQCSALVIWGQRDIFLPHRDALRQRDLFPDAQVHLLPDSGHFPYADNPQAVAALLLPFLRRQRAAAGSHSITG